MKKVVDSQVYKIIQKTTNGKDLVSKNVKKQVSSPKTLVSVTWYEKCMKPTSCDFEDADFLHLQIASLLPEWDHLGQFHSSP